MKKIYISAVLLIGLGSNAYSQHKSALISTLSVVTPTSEKSANELRGDKFYFIYQFEKAINAYKDANSGKQPLTSEGQRRLAESYQNMRKNTEAETTYSSLINANSGVTPEDYYSYAMILKINGKSEESAKWMDKFASVKPEDGRAKSYNANKQNLPAMQSNSGDKKVVNMNINSSSADFAPSYYKNKVVFTSGRRTPRLFQKKDNWNRQSFCNMYTADVVDNQLKNAENFDKDINAKRHDGPASFSKDGNFMAFTKSHAKDKSDDNVVELQIYLSTFSNEEWSEPEPFMFNNEGYSVGQPSLTGDGKTMYFTSDMPGGIGGTDLYKTTKDAGGTWQKPMNLGNKINTEGDEMFPFIEETKGFLFFSSNGHYGLGGYDIFYQPVNSESSATIKNLGTPINTVFDDFAIIVDGATNKGYFSSNRAGGIGDDDIYAGDLPESVKEEQKPSVKTATIFAVKIEGITKDANDKTIPFSTVKIQGSDGKVIDSLTTKETGFYSFQAVNNKNYVLTGNKSTYLEGTNVANTFSEDSIVRADVILLQTEIKVNEDLAKTIYLGPIHFDFAKYEIRPDAATQLDKIVKIMNQYPKMEVHLGAYTDCRGSEEYNGFLSDYRATTSINYIQSRISNPSRISGKGYGETKLINSCACEDEVISECSEAQHQENRRTEFIIKKK